MSKRKNSTKRPYLWVVESKWLDHAWEPSVFVGCTRAHALRQRFVIEGQRSRVRKYVREEG